MGLLVLGREIDCHESMLSVGINGRLVPLLLILKRLTGTHVIEVSHPVQQACSWAVTLGIISAADIARLQLKCDGTR